MNSVNNEARLQILASTCQFLPKNSLLGFSLELRYSYQSIWENKNLKTYEQQFSLELYFLYFNQEIVFTHCAYPFFKNLFFLFWLKFQKLIRSYMLQDPF